MLISVPGPPEGEALLRWIAREIEYVGGTTSIDLYADEELADPRKISAFSELRSQAMSGDPQGRARDRFVAHPLDLSRERDVQAFSLLATDVIYLESIHEGRVLFASGSPNDWVEFNPPAGHVQRIVHSLREKGMEVSRGR